MGEYAKYNAENILKNVEACIAELEKANKSASWDLDYSRYSRRGWSEKATTRFKMDAVYDELSIFDWWLATLSLSQLKQMKSFLTTAIKLGFNGYVCFKVGAKYCAHGMWAHKEESTNGYSTDCDTLYHSFRCGDNYWDVQVNGEWLKRKEGSDGYKFTLKEIKKAIA